MTNYMELIMSNQPWNLIFFMAIPVTLAESLVVTEFYCLYRNESSIWQKLNRQLGIIVGLYFTAIFCYFMINIFPELEWRGGLDKVAVIAYLAGVVPLLSITLLELGVLGKSLGDKVRRQVHFLLLTGFLVVSHIAMIFGMTEPEMPMTHEHMNHEHMHDHMHHNHS